MCVCRVWLQCVCVCVCVGSGHSVCVCRVCYSVCVCVGSGYSVCVMCVCVCRVWLQCLCVCRVWFSVCVCVCVCVCRVRSQCVCVLWTLTFSWLEQPYCINGVNVVSCSSASDCSTFPTRFGILVTLYPRSWHMEMRIGSQLISSSSPNACASPTASASSASPKPNRAMTLSAEFQRELFPEFRRSLVPERESPLKCETAPCSVSPVPE